MDAEEALLKEMQMHTKEWQEARVQQEMVCDWLWQELGLPQLFAEMQQEWKRREHKWKAQRDESRG